MQILWPDEMEERVRSMLGQQFKKAWAMNSAWQRKRRVTMQERTTTWMTWATWNMSWKKCGHMLRCGWRSPGIYAPAQMQENKIYNF
jgi:hypothetical protein